MRKASPMHSQTVVARSASSVLSGFSVSMQPLVQRVCLTLSSSALSTRLVSTSTARLLLTSLFIMQRHSRLSLRRLSKPHLVSEETIKGVQSQDGLYALLVFLLYLRFILPLTSSKTLTLDNKSKKIPFFFVLSSLNRIFAIKYHRTVVNDACHKAKIPECRVAARTFGTKKLQH